MNGSSRIFVLPVLALVVAVGLVRLDPFQYSVAGLVRLFGQGPNLTYIVKAYTDPSIQEVSNGEHPAQSFTKLAAAYRGDTRRRVDLIGNSQTYTFILAPGEHVPATTEKTYPDLLADHYASTIHFYRLSAPNVTYTEVLWYLLYLETHRELLPNELIVQVNYETFRKTGIRAGIEDLLADVDFRQRVMEIAGRDQLFSGPFQQAVAEYNNRRRASAQASSSATSSTGLTQSAGWGQRLETQTRNWLALTGMPAHQANAKADFLSTLYLMRVYLLNLKPSTPRSLAPAALAANREALREVARICRRDGVTLLFMNAPQNPRAPLYRNEDDRQQYRAAVQGVATEFSIPVFDFEDRVPADEWGSWADGPDPIHFGIKGHHRMAQLLIESGIIAAKRQ
jgi:hypothetical protein